MTGAVTWRGRRGAVILGPTEDRVARYLADRTRYGRVPIRTADLCRSLTLGRSEAYRITARLRVLGLFGVRNDRGGTLGGRWYWRTAIPHVGGRAGLDPGRRRLAWSRVLGAARARARAIADHLRHDRAAGTGRPVAHAPAVVAPEPPPARSFRDLFAAAGGADLLRQWRA